jgi:hypothetical protein
MTREFKIASSKGSNAPASTWPLAIRPSRDAILLHGVPESRAAWRAQQSILRKAKKKKGKKQ